MSKKKDLAQSSKFKMKALPFEGERKIRVIATSPTLDRDKEHIDSDTIRVPLKTGGWKYLKDMDSSDVPDIPLLVDHWWDIEKQAGSLESIIINDEGKTEAVASLSSVDNGERVYTLAKEGHLGNSFSIGFSLMDATFADNTWYNIELIELSAVAKGSNPDARLLEVKSIKESSMSDADKLKAEIEAKQKELAEVEAQEAETNEPEKEEVKVEVEAEVETTVEQPDEEVTETEQSEEETETQEETEEETKAIEKKDNKVKETKTMSNKDIAAEQVKEKAVPSQPSEAVKSISKRDARKLIVKSFAAQYEGNEKAVAELDKEMQGVKVINGTSGDPLFVPEILASDIRDRYEIVGNVGSLVNRIDIEGAETYRQLVETAGTGFQPVALGGVKPEDQPVWTSVVFEPFEWALIVAWLDGVQKRSPIAVYNQIVRYIAKEYRKLEDKIILTNPARTVGGESRPATGLVPRLSVSGRNDNVQSYAAKDVLPALAKAYGAIESDETITLVANRATWARLAVTMDANDNPIFTVVGNQVTVGALGSFNVVLSQELGEGEVVIGAYDDYNLVTRGQLATLFSREATVGSLNLFTQDASALRADVDITGGPVFIQSFYLLDFGVASSS